LSGQRAGASATCSPASSGSPWARNTTPEWLDDTVKGAPDGPAAFREGDGSGPGYPDGAHYRNCWWVTNPGLPMYNAAGIYGQSIFVHGPGQVVVAKLSSWPDALSAPMRRATVAAVHAIASALPDTCS
jgi:CubicO group peptidase (beta-lactamase class C family)